MKLSEGFKSTELWVTIVYAIAKTLMPTLDETVLYALFAYVGSRTGIKVSGIIKPKEKK